MNLQCLVSVILCSWLFVLPSAYCDDSEEEKRLGFFEKSSPVFMVKSPLHRLYLEWVAENLSRNPDANSNEVQLFNGLIEKRDRSNRHPALNAYFIYKINLDKCVNLGDEGCINGSIPGSGSDSGFLNGSGNPGK